jgi:hypothetical protein
MVSIDYSKFSRVSYLSFEAKKIIKKGKLKDAERNALGNIAEEIESYGFLHTAKPIYEEIGRLEDVERLTGLLEIERPPKNKDYIK